MRKSKHSATAHYFLLFLLIHLIQSCAQVVAPTGGEKDILPPKVVQSEPANPSVNFHGKKIQINFNEFVTLKELNSQLIISPPLKKTPEVKVKNKTLSMVLEDTLKPNTTYTFNFGNAIADYTEQNVIDNFQFVFSTGAALDSLTVSGKVQKSFNHVPEKGVLVMLYAVEKMTSDSFPYHELPDYFGKTNEFGNYSINNVRAGKYKLFALKDGNSNYLFDSDDEQISFVDSVLTIAQALLVDLDLFQEQKSKLYLKKPVKIFDGQLICAFSKPAEELSFEPLQPTQKFKWKATEISVNQDTARFWFAGAAMDSLKLKVISKGKTFDTLQVALPKVVAESAGREKKRLTITSTISSSVRFDLNKKISFLLSAPISKFLASKVILTNRKDTLPILVSSTDSLKRKFELAAKFLEDSTYQLLIPQGTFEDFNGLKNDTVRFVFRLLSQRDYGTLKLALKLKEGSGNFIFQLLDEKENVVNERFINKSEVLLFDFLQPQNYKFKLIADSNKNKKWDTGKFLEHRLAETTIYYPQVLTVRANWDLEEKWDLTK